MERFRNTGIPIFYAVSGALAVAWSALVVPPARVADEPNHILRSAQVADGRFIGDRSGPLVGGAIDSGLVRFVQSASRNVLVGPNAEESKATQNYGWENERTFISFANTTRYAPTTYLPQALGFWAGSSLDLRIVDSFILARLFNGFCAVAVCAWSIYVSERGKLFMAVVLSLPMAIFQMGSVSQDALILAFSALIAGLLTRRTPNRRDYILVAMSILIIAMGRYPLIALTGVLLLPRWQQVSSFSRSTRSIIVAVVTISFLLWFAWNMTLQMPLRPDVPASSGPQMQVIRHDPLLFFRAAWWTVFEGWRSWWRGFVGQLGWQNVPLSPKVYRICTATALLSGAACLFESATVRPSDRRVTFAVALTTVFLMLLANYLNWTPPGLDRIEGMQGRYFYSVLILLPVFLPVVRVPTWPIPRLSTMATIVCLICSVWVSVATGELLLKHYSLDGEGRKAVAWHIVGSK